MQKLHLSKNWRLEQKDKELYIYGGQDAIFTIDLESSEPCFFASLNPSKEFTNKDLNQQDKIVLEQLLSAEVIIPILKSRAKKPAISLVGDSKITAQFKGNAGISINNSPNVDLVVFVRSGKTFTSFLEQHDYSKMKKPHLLLDLAYHHIISIGPLVFPGLTSCVACLQGRLSARWGDAEPPAQPKSAGDLIGLSNEWLLLELRKIFNNENYSLVNKTVVFDTQERTITQNKLLTVPICPYCNKSKLLSNGKLEYTFFKA